MKCNENDNLMLSKSNVFRVSGMITSHRVMKTGQFCQKSHMQVHQLDLLNV